MPMNAGDGGHGAAPSAGVDFSEATPLLVPDHEAQPAPQWRPLTTQELEVAAGGPGWRKIRCYLLAMFWLTWVAIFAASVFVVVTSPRPVSTSLTWWQTSVFYQVQADLFLGEEDESGGFGALCDQLPDLGALGSGALILEGMFDDTLSDVHLSRTAEFRTRVAQVQHVLTESNKMDLKVVLDVCDVNVTGNADESSNRFTSDALLFWLEQGVAGFAICDTDAAYSEGTLLEWRSILKKFSKEVERILVVKQKGEALSPLNATLVDVVMRSILPPSQQLSATEISDAIKDRLQTKEDDVWISWTAGGKVPQDLKKLLLVLIMTLPGSPAVQYEEAIAQTQGVHISPSHGMNGAGSTSDTDKRSTLALLTSLSNFRSTEEPLRFGSFFLLSFNSSSHSSLASSSPPLLAYLRSWGCVHFLILLNPGPELRALDPGVAHSLPDTGVFVASTEMDRLGSITLSELHLRPHEAIIIKLVEAGSYS